MPRVARRIVCRAQNSRLLIQVGQYFLLVPNVIARGQYIHAPIKELVGEFGRDAIAGGRIFAVQDRQIDGVLLLQFAQIRAHHSASRAGDGVTDIKDFQTWGTF